MKIVLNKMDTESSLFLEKMFILWFMCCFYGQFNCAFYNDGHDSWQIMFVTMDIALCVWCFQLQCFLAGHG